MALILLFTEKFSASKIPLCVKHFQDGFEIFSLKLVQWRKFVFGLRKSHFMWENTKVKMAIKHSCEQGTTAPLLAIYQYVTGHILYL